MIEAEWQRRTKSLRTVTGCAELLDDVPWLKRSIAARNGYVDPLNLIQIELQRRGREEAGASHRQIWPTCGNWW